jgi:hypothetical protein
VILHYSHGVFQNIVLENEGNYWPLAFAFDNVVLENATNWRSPTLDAAIRGEHRSSVLLESMPSIMARNPNAIVRSRQDGPAARMGAESGSTNRGVLQEGDVVYRWLAESGVTSIDAINGRVMDRYLSELPSPLTILADHPQFLLRRPS